MLECDVAIARVVVEGCPFAKGITYESAEIGSGEAAVGVQSVRAVPVGLGWT